MRLSRFALTELCGLTTDLAITCLLIFHFDVDPLVARLPGATIGLAASWRLNRFHRDAPNALSGFLTNAITLICRFVSIGLFALLHWRNPIVQPLVPLVFSVLAALALALYGYSRLQRQRLEQD